MDAVKSAMLTESLVNRADRALVYNAVNIRPRQATGKSNILAYPGQQGSRRSVH